MTRINVEVPDDVAEELQRRASGAGLSVSEYLCELLERRPEDEWTDGFFEQVAGGWSDPPVVRPEQGQFEKRTDAD